MILSGRFEDQFFLTLYNNLTHILVRLTATLLTHILCTEIAHMVPTSRPVPAILTDKAAGEEGPRIANSDNTTHAARVSKLEYHAVGGHSWWLESLS